MWRYRLPLRSETRLTADGAVLDWSERTYDDIHRLRSLSHSDGTSETNAYSCCRLLWRCDREGRKTLRSAQTGTDSLYYAEEDVWLGEAENGEWGTGNGGFRVTQHFFDGLGRETNTVTYAGSTPGEAVVPSHSSQLSQMSQTSTEYLIDEFNSHAQRRTDERGKVTERSTDIADYSHTETTETVSTNGVVVLTTKSRSYLGGGTSLRREWIDVAAAPSPSQKWTDERRFTDYAPDGRRIERIVTESSDNGVVTNSVSTYDLLGRLVTVATPCTALGGSQSPATAITSNAYDGASTRILSSTFHAPALTPRTTFYIYNDLGEQVGTVLDGVTNRTDTAYETNSSNVVWRVFDPEVL